MVERMVVVVLGGSRDEVAGRMMVLGSVNGGSMV